LVVGVPTKTKTVFRAQVDAPTKTAQDFEESRKSKRQKHTVPSIAGLEARANPWIWISGATVVALLAAFTVYWPAIHGPFLFDDQGLTYSQPNANLILKDWVNQTRPLLMFTFWLNYQQSGGQETFGYHAVNLFLHFFNAIFAFLAVRKVLSWTPVEEPRNLILSLFAAGMFLLHPVQTESVSYIASRSETLSVFFVLAAFVVYLYRPTAVTSVSRILTVLTLFAAATLSKEHTVVIPALFILTDYYWNFKFSWSVVWRNWKFYIPITVGATLALAAVLRILHGSLSAGLHPGLTWHQYFFTECRIVWQYILLFVIPIGQNLDPDIDISGNILAHSTIFGIAGLLGISALAWAYRRRFPIASYGWFAFLILLAPTSSFIPIRDPMAEHRLYLPFIGLLLIIVEFTRRWKVPKNVFIRSFALVLALESVMTYQRNLLWGNEIDMWKDAVSKSPRKLRPRFQLAYAYIDSDMCSEAADQFKNADALEFPKNDPLFDWHHQLVRGWGLAYQCAGNPQQAIAKLEQAVAEHPEAQLYSLIGMEYGKIGKYPEALEALATAQRLDSGYALTYYNLGNIHAIEGKRTQAVEDYQRVLELVPHYAPAREALFRMGVR
jgi:protein O-mannosyl-transferase